MPAKISIGTQDFEKLRTGKYFYIDKTDFIKEWWEAGDDVTLVVELESDRNVVSAGC